MARKSDDRKMTDLEIARAAQVQRLNDAIGPARMMTHKPISPDQFADAYIEQKIGGPRTNELLLDEGLIDEEQAIESSVFSRPLRQETINKVFKLPRSEQERLLQNLISIDRGTKKAEAGGVLEPSRFDNPERQILINTLREKLKERRKK